MISIVNQQPLGWRLIVNQIQFWLMFDKNIFSIYKQKWLGPVQKVSKLYTFLESTYPEMQRNTFLQYIISIVNEQPPSWWLISIVKQQLPGGRLISIINQIKLWFMCDENIFFHIQAKWQYPVKKVSKLYTFWESTYPEMQRNTFLEYMKISRQPAATVLVDVWQKSFLHIHTSKNDKV